MLRARRPRSPTSELGDKYHGQWSCAVGNVTLGIADLNASYGEDITSNGGVLDSDGSHATSTGCVFYGDSITAGLGATVTANS